MFECLALREYLDTAYLREVQRGYLREQFKRVLEPPEGGAA